MRCLPLETIIKGTLRRRIASTIKCFKKKYCGRIPNSEAAHVTCERPALPKLPTLAEKSMTMTTHLKWTMISRVVGSL